MSFPSAELTASELQQQIASVNQLAVAALIAGIVGLLAGLGGIYFGMRNRRRTDEDIQQAPATADATPTGAWPGAMG